MPKVRATSKASSHPAVKRGATQSRYCDALIGKLANLLTSTKSLTKCAAPGLAAWMWKGDKTPGHSYYCGKPPSAVPDVLRKALIIRQCKLEIAADNRACAWVARRDLPKLNGILKARGHALLKSSPAPWR